jgi:hypothetical protein
MESVFEAKKKGKKGNVQPGGEPIPLPSRATKNLAGIHAQCPVDEAVDVRTLRNPMTFVTGVDQFLKDLDGDVKTLNHFASTYKQSVKLPPDQKAKFGKLEFPLKMLSKFGVELGNQNKALVGGQLDKLQALRTQQDKEKAQAGQAPKQPPPTPADAKAFGKGPEANRPTAVMKSQQPKKNLMGKMADLFRGKKKAR